MLEQTDRKSIDKLVNHVTENSSNSIEALIGLADVCQAHVVQENTLNNEDSNLEGEEKGVRSKLIRNYIVLQFHVIWSMCRIAKTYCLGQLASGLHDAETEGNDLGGEQESDDFSVVVLRAEEKKRCVSNGILYKD